jgi:hypothetical protein
MWCWRLQQGERAQISDITDQFVEINKTETAVPNAANVEVYQQVQELQNELSKSLRDVFGKHRQFVLR